MFNAANYSQKRKTKPSRIRAITAWRVLLIREIFERQLKRIFTDRDGGTLFKGPHIGCLSETRRIDTVI
jgi:hypothetical protein